MARGPFDKKPFDDDSVMRILGGGPPKDNLSLLGRLLGVDPPKEDGVTLSALSGLFGDAPKDDLSGIKKSAYDYLNPFTQPPPPPSSTLASLLGGPIIPPPPKAVTPPPLKKATPGVAPSIAWCKALMNYLLKQKATVVGGRVLPGIDDLAVMEGRRVRAAFVYSDLHGFTKLVASQPENKSFIFLHSFVRMASHLTKHYGGEVMDVAGDRVLSVFHRPLGNKSNEPVEDAVAFALWLQTIFINVIGPAFSGGGLGQLSLGIGIDYGEAVVGCVGIRNNKRIVFFGDPANNAAKLQDIAGAGETILSGAADARRPSYLDHGKWVFQREKLASGEVVMRIRDYFAGDNPAKAR